MTLLRQIMLVVILIFVVIFGGNFVLTVLESRSYVETQLRAHAQDTATSLGLSLTTALTHNDQANLELLTSAVFDRGYYSKILLEDITGKTLILRTNALALDDIPHWFVESLDLPSPQGRAEITKGWTQLGVLTVEAHPGNAYRDLWRITVDFSWLFALMVVLSYGLFGIVIRLVMSPLKAVEAQANDICNRQFAILTPIPRTRELKRVVEAMNRMSHKLKSLFENQVQITEKLRIEAKTDAVTGLNNRQEFEALVTANLQSEQGAGSNTLMLLQIRDFAQVNDFLGFAAADDLLQQVAHRLTLAFSNRDNVIIARRNGAEFSIFIPRISFELARISLERAFQEVASLQLLTEATFTNKVHMSAAFSDVPIDLSVLLTDADTALRTAQANSVNGSYFLIHGNQDNPISDLVKQARQWRSILLDQFEREDFLFHYQPIYQLNSDGNRAHLADEIFVRIMVDDQIVSAGVFMPMAERFGMLLQLDQLIISRALKMIDQSSPKIVINLSNYSLQDESFRNWLASTLEENSAQADRVIFELQEHAIHLAYESTRDVIAHGYKLGYQFSIDHFGTSAASFAYLQSIDLSYIKIDRSFVSKIDINTDNQFFVASVVQIAHARDMLVIAEGVERDEELETLISLDVDAAMGYLLGRPGPEISLT